MATVIDTSMRSPKGQARVGTTVNFVPPTSVHRLSGWIMQAESKVYLHDSVAIQADVPHTRPNHLLSTVPTHILSLHSRPSCASRHKLAGLPIPVAHKRTLSSIPASVLMVRQNRCSQSILHATPPSGPSHHGRHSCQDERGTTNIKLLYQSDRTRVIVQVLTSLIWSTSGCTSARRIWR